MANSPDTLRTLTFFKPLPMTTPSAIAIAHEFWSLMATNEFDQVSKVLANEFILDYPQTMERIRGAERFAQFNREYPAHGPWQFTVHRVIGSETESVSDVTVTDGVITGHAISFFFVAKGLITHIIEYWPDLTKPAWDRKHLTEPLED